MFRSQRKGRWPLSLSGRLRSVFLSLCTDVCESLVFLSVCVSVDVFVCVFDCPGFQCLYLCACICLRVHSVCVYLTVCVS